MKASDSKLSITSPVVKLTIHSLVRKRSKPNFGNAGAVDSIPSQHKQNEINRSNIRLSFKRRF